MLPGTAVQVNVCEMLATSGPGLVTVPGDRFGGGGVVGDGGTHKPSSSTSAKHEAGEEIAKVLLVPTRTLLYRARMLMLPVALVMYTLPLQVLPLSVTLLGYMVPIELESCMTPPLGILAAVTVIGKTVPVT